MKRKHKVILVLKYEIAFFEGEFKRKKLGSTIFQEALKIQTKIHVLLLFSFSSSL